MFRFIAALAVFFLLLAGVAASARAQSQAASVSSGPRFLDLGVSGLFSGGGSSEPDSVTEVLQAGAHDPKGRGFTFQQVELSLGGAVDPYFRGDVFVILQLDRNGETHVEIEEAALTTLSLPHALQVKAGQYFTEFGRLNATHPHAWGFVDQPVVNSRMFGGDGLRNPGVRLSWLAPLPWFSEAIAGIQHPAGGTAVSFLNTKENESFAGHAIQDRPVRTFADMLYALRWLNSWDLSPAATLNLGVSGLFGPNATGSGNRTEIYGLDAYLKWKPVVTERGFPFVSWQTEVMARRYEAGEDKALLRDRGLYTQILWGFAPRWVAGLRYDWADGDDPQDPMRDRRRRVSPNVTYYPTEFSKLRLQVNVDRPEHLNKDVYGVWLQAEFLLGAHAAHAF